MSMTMTKKDRRTGSEVVHDMLEEDGCSARSHEVRLQFPGSIRTLATGPCRATSSRAFGAANCRLFAALRNSARC